MAGSVDCVFDPSGSVMGEGKPTVGASHRLQDLLILAPELVEAALWLQFFEHLRQSHMVAHDARFS